MVLQHLDQPLNWFPSDETRIHYIEEAVNQAFATFGKRKAPKGAMNRGGRHSPEGSPGPGDGGGSMAGAVGGASNNIQSDDYYPEAYVNICYRLLYQDLIEKKKMFSTKIIVSHICIIVQAGHTHRSGNNYSSF